MSAFAERRREGFSMSRTTWIRLGSLAAIVGGTISALIAAAGLALAMLYLLDERLWLGVATFPFQLVQWEAAPAVWILYLLRTGRLADARGEPWRGTRVGRHHRRRHGRAAHRRRQRDLGRASLFSGGRVRLDPQLQFLRSEPLCRAEFGRTTSRRTRLCPRHGPLLDRRTTTTRAAPAQCPATHRGGACAAERRQQIIA